MEGERRSKENVCAMAYSDHWLLIGKISSPVNRIMLCTVSVKYTQLADLVCTWLRGSLREAQEKKGNAGFARNHLRAFLFIPREGSRRRMLIP
jgi:hypothetical protein